MKRKLSRVVCLLVAIVMVCNLFPERANAGTVIPNCPKGHPNNGFGRYDLDDNYCYYHCDPDYCEYCTSKTYPVAHDYSNCECIYCGYVKHDWSKKDGICANCSAECPDKASHSCSEDCLTCGGRHQFGELIPRVEPTCATPGCKAHYKCTKCECLFTESKGETTEAWLMLMTVPGAHPEDKIHFVKQCDATCTEDGVKAYWHCDECGYDYANKRDTDPVYDADLKIPAAHQFSELIPRVEPTCGRPGKKAYYVCNECNSLFNESKGETTEGWLLLVTVPAAHPEDKIYFVKQCDATCTEDGVKAHWHCDECGYDFANKTDTDPVCDEDIKIPAAHQFSELIPRVEPTCVLDGKDPHYVCAVCHDYFDEDKNPAAEAQLVIAARGHDWSDKTGICVKCGTACPKAKGHVETEACEVCGFRGSANVSFDVSFDVQGIGTAPDSIKATSGSAIKFPVEPSANGYKFSGWFKEAECINEWNEETDVVQGETVIYAKWTSNGNDSAVNVYPESVVVSNTYKNDGDSDKQNKGDNTGSIAKVPDTGNNTGDNTAEGLKTTGFAADTAIEGDYEVPETVIKNGTNYKVNEIANDAFSGSTGMTGITINDNIAIIGRRAFLECDGLSEVKIGENVSVIRRSAFARCDSLNSVMLNDNLEILGQFAFKGCTSLKSVDMGEGLKNISRSVFSGCTSLETITIPASVETMGKNLFYGCTNLKEITIKTTKLTKKNLSKDFFNGMPEDVVIYVPASVKENYKKLFAEAGLGDKAVIKAIGEK